MPRSEAIYGAFDGEEFILAEPEEADTLAELGLIEQAAPGTAAGYKVAEPYEESDVVDSLEEMRSPDQV